MVVTLEEPVQEKGTRRPRRAGLVVLALFGVVGLATAAGTLRAGKSGRNTPAPPPAAATAATVQVSVDRTSVRQVATLATGATHGQYSLDPWGKPGAIARGKALLAAATHYQAQ